MNLKYNPSRRSALLWAGIMVLGLIIIFLPWIIGLAGDNGGFALSFLGTRWSHGVLEFTRLYNLLRYGQAPVPLSTLRRILEEMKK